MQPQNPNQQSANPNPYSFADLTPIQPQGSGRRKKLYIIAGVSFAVLLLLALVTALTADKKTTVAPMETATSTAQTKVEMADFDKEGFTLKYPKSLNVLTIEALEDQPGWYLNFKPSDTEDTYSVSLISSATESPYADGEEALSELVPEDVELRDIQTSDVVVAGVKSKKTTGLYTRDGVEYVKVYAYAHPDEQHFLEVIATYDKKLTDITDSLDVLLGSIKLR